MCQEMGKIYEEDVEKGMKRSRVMASWKSTPCVTITHFQRRN